MSTEETELLYVPYGEVAYETFRRRGRAFADKSLMIKQLEDMSTPLFPVLLRPRRFGKSTFVQMLKCFYDLSYRDMYEELFSGTAIYKEDLPSHNTYHVICFDFSSVNPQSLNTTLNSFFSAVINGIDSFMRRYPDFTFSYSDLDSSDSVTLFSRFATAYAGYAARCSGSDSHDHTVPGRLYVMIDEYDSFASQILTQDADMFQAITGANGFLKAFYAAIKAAASSADCIARTFITGVSSVSLDSLTAGFNIARNITTWAGFNEYAGFTAEELADLIPRIVDVRQLGVTVDEIIARMRPVYDGYCFSPQAGRTVFNSSMCLYYLDEMRLTGKFLPPEIYLDPASDHDGSKLWQLFALSEKKVGDQIISKYLNGERFYLDKLAQNINLNETDLYSRQQFLSMLYYLGYLTIDREASDDSRLALKVPNLFMSKLFAQCTVRSHLRTSSAFADPKLDLSAMLQGKDDLSSFASSCTEFLSSICTNQVLTHMNEMALNLTLYAKLDSVKDDHGFAVTMQKSLQVAGEGENYADLVITVNEGQEEECCYLFELKYIPKDQATASLISKRTMEASEQARRYRSALDFRGRKIRAYAMIFVGPCCQSYQLQEVTG